ncbi:antiviral innate immune response receptor RIG-I-like isoform X2 [Pristis pectinata]|uniref:antiviral innate immune response receptor RIG-I-like isoform X2 n=1 Tax=Pristis pectinata TaxID=685728 RepID=UPI00223D3403|nr:antiviral innate immune response receptor RIG-I-like isoform X2 [Pristis pectinata]XP_051875328.1 antiviral innate immune response receptor RIG-I-like isoform X2 [Pristis pectinata]
MHPVDRENLKQWEGYITSILRPSYIQGFLNNYFSPVEVEEILSLEEKSSICSAKCFLNYLIKLEERGCYRAFLDELGAVGYTGLQEAIEKADFSEIEKLQENKELLSRISQTIVSNIKPNEVIMYMRQSLLPRECEEISKVTESKGDTAGAEKLLDCLRKSDKQQFFKEFCLAMETCNYDVVVTLLSPDSGEISNSSVITEDVLYYSEQPEKMNTCSAAIDSTANFQQNSNATKQLKLRAYQEELAEAAVAGDNTIICAPTGSGKTIVALHIAEHHLMERPEGEKRKVCFMATTVPVFQQQLELFKHHFQKTSFRVHGICGDTVSNSPVEIFVDMNDIVILTPQILLNCLKYGQISSLSVFTLLIFDECHNTAKNHPYNVLMKKYLDIKMRPSPLPQIVGLTASIGVGDASSVRDAMDYILHICANLDAESISTVNRNMEELEKFVFVSEKQTREATRRMKDPFADIIRQMMVQVEGMAKRVYNIDELSHIQNQNRGSQKYEQWIIEVQKSCKVLQMKDVEKERKTCRALFTYTEHLRKYNDALIINDDARTKDAVNYLDHFFTNVKGGGYDETEQLLTALFEAKKQQLLTIEADPAYENPKLTEVRKILCEEYRKNPKTKTIMFVRTRALADALRNWLKDTETLAFLQPEMLLGRSKNTGMTLPSQKEVLNSFRNESGGSKILVATSVADEGIDIVQCNLVLLYEYVGNVIKMIQTRGRGRAQGSKCILVTSKKEQVEKEMINSAQEKMMYKAIQELQQWDRPTFSKKINIIQADEKKMREFKSNESTDKPAESYKLLCGKCKIYACDSDDIRIIEDAHHAVIDKTFLNRYQTQPHKKPKNIGSLQKREKLHCKDCAHDWGITANFNVFKDLPVIKIDSFVLHNIKTGAPCIVKKWKDVPFSIKKFDSGEFCQEI